MSMITNTVIVTAVIGVIAGVVIMAMHRTCKQLRDELIDVRRKHDEIAGVMARHAVEQMARAADDRQRRSAAASRGHENRRRKAVKISEWEGQA